MNRKLALAYLAFPLFSAAQIRVTPQRIAGLPPADWPIGDGGPAVNARLSPTALAWDRNGNLLIADARYNRIRRLTPDGIISTVIDAARYGLSAVVGMAVDGKGNLFLTEVRLPKARILQIPPGGNAVEITSPGAMNLAPGIVVDASDNLYITDQENGYVWKRSPSGAVEKIAGKGGLGLADQGGPALEVTLVGPHSLALDRAGNLLITDWAGTLRLNPDGTLVRLFGGRGIVPGIHTVRIAASPDGSIYATGDWYGIWRWEPSAGIQPFAGTEQLGFSDGCAQSGGTRLAKYASLHPADLAVDAAGRLYVADNNAPTFDSAPALDLGRVRRIDPDGSIRTVAGPGGRPGGPDLSGMQAILQGPAAIAADGSGNVFFAEPYSNRVYQITATGRLLTIAGKDSPPGGEDPACYPSPGKDTLSAPGGLALDTEGNLYVSDTGNHRVLRRRPDGTITAIAAGLSSPSSIAVDRQQVVYFLDGFALHRIQRDGLVEPVATPQPVSSITIGFDGLLVLNGLDVYRQTASGRFYPLAPSGGVLISADPVGAIYTGPLRMSPNCNRALIEGLEWIGIRGMASDSQGNLYRSDSNFIWRIPPISPIQPDSLSPQLVIPGIFNAASNITALVSIPSRYPLRPPTIMPTNDSVTGNEIVRIKGGCLGPLEPVNATLDGGRLPTALAGTQVLVDGVPAPLLSVQSAEIVAILPQSVAAKTKVGIAVENQGARVSADLDAASAVPGIFVIDGTQAAALNEDSSVNGPEHPAPAGSVVSLFLTGAGVTDPLLEDGVPPGPVPRPLALPVTVSIGGVSADVLYAGAAPGLPGVAQLNIRLPRLAASDAAPLTVSVGGISRNQRVTLAVK